MVMALSCSPDGALAKSGAELSASAVPHCAIGRRFAPCRWLHAGYEATPHAPCRDVLCCANGAEAAGETPRARRQIDEMMEERMNGLFAITLGLSVSIPTLAAAQQGAPGQEPLAIASE